MKFLFVMFLVAGIVLAESRKAVIKIVPRSSTTTELELYKRLDDYFMSQNISTVGNQIEERTEPYIKIANVCDGAVSGVSLTYKLNVQTVQIDTSTAKVVYASGNGGYVGGDTHVSRFGEDLATILRYQYDLDSSSTVSPLTILCAGVAEIPNAPQDVTSGASRQY